MEQRTLLEPGAPGLHVAIIMDGNGRWANSRGLPRIAGHRAGADAVRRAVEAAPGLGIRTLTLFAFSSDNWQRPPREVAALMRLFRTYLLAENEKCLENGIKIEVVGRRDRFQSPLLLAIGVAESRTKMAKNLRLRLAVDYSARDSIMRAAREFGGGPEFSREAFSRLLAEAEHSDESVPEVDLLIRTGGEQRLSDFLLWECAYAEFLFTPRMWPDFDASDLESAVKEFHGRQRRFGRVPEAAAV